MDRHFYPLQSLGLSPECLLPDRHLRLHHLGLFQDKARNISGFTYSKVTCFPLPTCQTWGRNLLGPAVVTSLSFVRRSPRFYGETEARAILKAFNRVQLNAHVDLRRFGEEKTYHFGRWHLYMECFSPYETQSQRRVCSRIRGRIIR